MRTKLLILFYLFLSLFYFSFSQEKCDANLLNNINIGYPVNYTLSNGQYIFIADRKGIKILDAESLVEVNKIDFRIPRKLKILDEYLLVGGDDGIKIFSINQNMKFVSNITNTSVFDLLVEGNIVIAACGCNGVRIYDISDIRNPTKLSSYLKATVYDISIKKNVLYASGNGSLKLLDISDPNTIKFIESYFDGNFITSIVLYEDYIFAATTRKIKIIKFSYSKKSFDKINEFSVEDKVQSINTLHNLLFVSTDNGIYIYDISNPLNPKQVESFGNALFKNISFYKNLLLISGDTSVYIYNMENLYSCYIKLPPEIEVTNDKLNLHISTSQPIILIENAKIFINNYLLANVKNAEKLHIYWNEELVLSVRDNDTVNIPLNNIQENNALVIEAQNQLDNIKRSITIVADFADSDNDNIFDIEEIKFGLNPYSLDSDNDGIPDSQEFQNGRDTDNDGIIDALDTDSDNDGISDKDEVAYGLDPFTNDAGLDSDNDGFTNIEEIEKGTNPNDKTSFPVYSISVDPSTIDFGEALLSEELTKTINIKNTGNQPISIENVYSESGIISIENNCPISLDPNEMCQITVFLSSSQEGNIEDILVIETTAKTINLPITASIIDPEIPVVLEWQNEYFTKLSVQSNDTYRIYIKDLDNNVFLDREVNNTSLLIPSFFLSPEKMYQVLIRSGKKENSLEISGLAINGDNNNNGLEDYKEIKITDKFAMLKTESGKNMPLGLSTDGEFLKIVDILDIQEIYKQNLNIDYGILGIVVKNGSFIKVEFPESAEISTIDPITKEIKEIKGNVINLKEEDIDGLDNSVSVVVVAIKGQLQNREMQDIDNDLISGSLDEDNDGIPDFTEGYSDTDNDGLPDFKDPDADGDNVPDFIEDKETYKQGNRIKVVINNDVLSKIQDDIPESVKGKEIEISVSDNDAVIKPIDGKTLPVFDPVEKPKEFKFPYGVFSFQIENISPGETVNIVIKLPAPIPEDASLIKYTNTTNYVTIDNVHSSLDGSNWEEGLVPGNIYIKYPVQDGGIYDQDGQINGKIIDPVGVAVLDEVSDNQDNVPSDNQDQNTDNQVSDSQMAGASSGGGGCSLSKESDISLVFVVILLAFIGARRLKDVYKVQTN